MFESKENQPAPLPQEVPSPQVETALAQEPVQEPVQEPAQEAVPEAPVRGTVNFASPVDFPVNGGTTESEYVFSLPSKALKGFTDSLRRLESSQDFDESSEAFKRWQKVSNDSVGYYSVGGLYQDRLDDPASRFEQGIAQPDGELLGIRSPRFKKTDGEIQGEMALLKVSKVLGLGDVLTIPLPHSGISVTLKPPTERDIIDFYNTVFREKIYVGRMTEGLTLTNHSVYINNRLFDFIVRHIHSINYGDIAKDQLKNFILLPDFPILAWGFACTLYPNGFEYERACCEDIAKCQYVAKATLNLLKLYCVDNQALSVAQREILAVPRPGKLIAEHWRKYQVEHTRVKSRTATLKNGMRLGLRVPSFAEHVSDGLGWVDKLNSATDAIIIIDGSEEETRRETLQQYLKATLLRQFSHYVDYIQIEEDEVVNPITDRDTINSILELLSSDDAARSEITNEILKFKSDTTIALIGLPEYKCPSCQTSQNPYPVNEAFQSAIALDVMNLFFTLLTLRMSKIAER